MTISRGDEPEHFKKRQSMVGWFDPRLLALTGFEAATAEVFGSFVDKRELEELHPPQNIEGCPKQPDAWIDFVADCGDAFDPTYSVAWHLGRENLTVDDAGTPLTLPRGGYLIMGGDQIYPFPSRDRYLNQTIGPYSHAMPPVAEPDRPKLLALPGNHDWYDGLSVFLEQFGGGNKIGGWDSPQTRSYFAVPLPEGWWLWGVDAGLGGHIDAPQKRYFQSMELAKGDRVIMCWSTPTWCQCDDKKKADNHKLLEAFVKEVIVQDEDDPFATVPLYLSGDWHHYARYHSSDADWVTAGGGGAFLFPTHHLSRSLSPPGRREPLNHLHLNEQTTFPDQKTSKRFLRKLFLFPWYNPSFLIFTTVIEALMAWAIESGLRRADGDLLSGELRRLTFVDVLEGFARAPAAILLALLVVVGFTGFAKPAKTKDISYRWIGFVHGLAHVAICLLVMSLASAWIDPIDSDVWFHVLYLPTVAAVAGLLSGVLVGFYLLVTNSLFGMHDNEASSALHSRKYKHFLRMHVTKEHVEVFVIGLRNVGRGWECNEDAQRAPADQPPCKNPKVVKPQLVERFTVARDREVAKDLRYRKREQARPRSRR